MLPFVLNGEAWRVVRVIPGDPSLVDRTGIPRIATADSENRIIRIAASLTPPMLDKVLLHEIAHAVTTSYGINLSLRSVLPMEYWILVEELIASIVENYSIEATRAASESLGRPICVRGYCAR